MRERREREREDSVVFSLSSLGQKENIIKHILRRVSTKWYFLINPQIIRLGRFG